MKINPVATEVKYIFTTFLVLIIYTAHAFQIDSLKQAYQKETSVSKKIELIEGILSVYASNPSNITYKEAEKYFDDGVRFCKENGDRIHLINFYLRWSYLLKSAYKYDSALKYAKLGTNLALSLNNIEGINRGGYIQAMILIDKDDWVAAVSQIRINLKYLQENPNEFYYKCNYSLVAKLNSAAGNDMLYQYYLEKADLVDEEDWKDFRKNYEFKIIENLYFKKIDQADSLLSILKNKYPAHNAKPKFICSYLNICKAYIDLGNDEAITEILETLIKNQPESIDLAEMRVYKATIHIQKNEFDQAKKLNDLVLTNPYSNYIKSIALENDILLNLHYSSNKATYNSFKELLQLKNRDAYENNLVSFLIISSLDELERTGLKLKDVEEENSFQRIHIESDKRIKLFLSLLLICSFLLTIGVLWLLRKLQLKNLEITKQRNEIEEQAKVLKSTNHMKDKIFSLIGHELRSPLAELIGILDVKKRISKYESAISYVEDIHVKSQNIYETLNNLLHWSAAQLQFKKLELESLNLKELTEEVIEGVSDLIKDKQIELSCNLFDARISASKNPCLIVIRNIIHNAVKFTPVNGNISIRIMEENEFYVLKVKDSGEGFPEEISNRILREVQKSGEGTAGEKGSGIGLFISNDLMQRQGGKISIDNNNGAEVALYFVKESN